MIETRTVGAHTEIHATTGYLHKVGSKEYAEIRTRYLLPGESVTDYEELTVDELELRRKELADKSAYEELVSELIHRRYSPDDELALINNVLAGATARRQEEYAEYQEYREACKTEARKQIYNQ